MYETTIGPVCLPFQGDATCPLIQLVAEVPPLWRDYTCGEKP